MTEKIYTPEVIQSSPFPVLGTAIMEGAKVSATGKASAEILTPQKVAPKAPYERPLIATETIGTALDTSSRQILGSFTFATLGAIQVGEYVNGESGDVRITPNGITARDANGITTFALDGITGNATFKGTVQAGTLISGLVVVGNNTWVIDGDEDTPRIILYNGATPEIVIGEI